MLHYRASLMIDRRWHTLTERIHAACQRANRNHEDVELVLVTKEIAPNEIERAYRLGVRDFGESQVQEWAEKRRHLPLDIRWHFMGSLQTNKVKFLVGQVALIHSCDRLDLAKALQKEAEKHHRIVDVLIQVNTSGEETKHGFQPNAVAHSVSEILAFNCLNIRGLMTIGPHTEDKKRIRSSFQSLRALRDRLQRDFPNVDWHYLSMGMSSDFELAIEEGGNLLRIGSAVFGERARPTS